MNEQKVCGVRPRDGKALSGAGGNDDVVLFAPAGAYFLRTVLKLFSWFNDGESSEEVMKIHDRLLTRYRERKSSILRRQMPGDGSRHTHGMFIGGRGNHAGNWIVKNNAQLPLIFAAEFANLQRAGFGCRFPIEVPCRIFRHVLANPI